MVQDRNNVPQTIRVSGERDVITSPSLLRWAVEGKVFEAGYGLEDTAIDSESTVNDITATFSLQAPAAKNLLVIPILLKLCLTDDGGALQVFQVSFTKPAALCATVLTLSGTALTSKHCLYRTGGAAIAEQQASALSTVTVSALVAADYISYHRGNSINSALTSGLVTMGSGPSNVQTFRFLEEGAPHILTSGAAMLIDTSTASTDSKWTAYMQWAEVTENDLH